jgi:hypothetical protein
MTEARTMDTHTWHQKKSGWGDAAVDGLLSGAAAGVLMAAFLLAAGWTAGQSWDWVLRQFDPGPTPSPLTGAVTHLAVSGVYGILFGSLWRPISRISGRLPAWLAGLAYGLLLLALAVMITSARATFGGGGWLQGIPPAQLAAAHTIYGLSLGWLVGRSQKR